MQIKKELNLCFLMRGENQHYSEKNFKKQKKEVPPGVLRNKGTFLIWTGNWRTMTKYRDKKAGNKGGPQKGRNNIDVGAGMAQ